MPSFSFDLLATNNAARRGRVTTAHGTFETPCFMATGTAATVKGMTFDSVRAAGAELVICNTYHLMIRPGSDRIAALGGLHKFMGWSGPILTDSGGYQVMSLAKLRTMDEKGVIFRSHIDGTKHELTPERSVQIQRDLDSNISLCLDECTPYPTTHEQAAQSMRLSMRWAQRSKNAFVPREGYALFGINQGGMNEDLRQESAQKLQAIGFDGYAIGGLSVGEGQDEMFRVLDATLPHLPTDKPRYLLGVGWPDDIVGAVKRGVDMFDCVIPTRSGRTGQGLTRRGAINIRNARHQMDTRPIDDQCTCIACRNHSRAYLHHLFRAGEMLGPILLTAHNVQYYQDLMAGMRKAIEEQKFDDFTAAFYEGQDKGDIDAIS
jgi:queuine tRNA-ribosyltransferase